MTHKDSANYSKGKLAVGYGVCQGDTVSILR